MRAFMYLFGSGLMGIFMWAFADVGPADPGYWAIVMTYSSVGAFLLATRGGPPCA